MGLSEDLISQFVKATKDEPAKPSETTVYGTTVNYNGKTYVKIDGSELLTPVKSTASVSEGDKVTVVIGNHTATITGNISDPSASSKTVEKQGSKINEFEIVMAYKVTTDDLEAVNASIEKLKATTARIEDATIVNAEIERLEAIFAELEHVNATDIQAITATIESIEALFGEFKDISTEDLEAVNAEITNLKGYTADFTYVSADVLEAMKASIKTLEAEKLSVKDADIKYANIDFANIGEAAIKKIFSDSGIIKDLVVNEGHITGELVGVTIKGDLIEGNTIKADKLVVLGSDGLYYKLNFESGNFTDAEEVPTDGIHGSVIVADSITAEKIVSEDLVAFGATIAGFHIEGATDEKPGAIYSKVKDSIDNTTEGVYLSDDGQANIGNGSNFLKFFKDEDGQYKLAISASSIKFASSGKTVEETINDSDNELNRQINEQIAAINTATNNITETINSLDQKTTGQLSELIDEIKRIQSDVELKMDSESVMIEIQKTIESGSSRVDTGTGFTFNEEGLTINKIDSDGNSISPTNTKITENGMTVNSNVTGDENPVILTANKDGVDAKNLHASTYLIIAGSSRFEEYPENRIGCFWIGR